MDIRNRRAVRTAAAEALAAAPGNPQKIVLIYAGVTALLGLLSSVVALIVDSRIAGTGGLGNMGLRSILATVQTILPMAQSIIVVFLGFGYQSAVLAMARRQRTGPDSLLNGFRRFGPLLRLMLLESLLFTGILFVAMYLGAQIFVMTPLARDFLELMMPLVANTSVLSAEVVMDEATMLAATEAMMPMFPIIGVVFLLIAAPIVYQYRMAVFALFDEPQRGALAAMRESRRMMRGNRLSLFKFDLGFWWYYGLEILIMALCYGDVLLPMLGVSFPWSAAVSYFLFYIVSLALEVGLNWLFMNRVNVTYATVYETIRPRQEEQKVALGNIFEM